ncbi:PAS domain-containing sensor histidine kinase [Halorubellus sp. JP-L1]|uniref:PAS domain-containing protein n=1 Tax=Halorubellus sp. JP-L1 TaxID=2715753 RepID=UPI00140D1B14|nr:PAS domain S-box protein [Halorubellus sp. JP-L1]NHN41793.1 PAS domain-containing sensor histidine kinase [Halorubellus sp. JP-L1]
MAPTGSLDVLLDHAQDKIVLVDEDGVVTYANDAVRRILGYEPEDVVGTNAFDYMHPEDVDEVREGFRRLVDADDPAETTATYRFAAADGSWVALESRMSNCRDGDLDGYVVSSRDVTDRIAAERDQRETSARLQELAATTSDVLWMFNADWSELLFVNPAYEDVYGGDVDELRANPGSFLDTIHPEDVPRVEDAMTRLSAGESMNMEYRVNEHESYTVWVWVQAEPILEDGDVVRITGFSRDVTDRRRRERQLYVMDTLLRHNLRNDLTVVLGEADRIASEHPAATDRTDVIRATANDLLESAEKGRRIVERMDADTTKHPVDVAALVERCAADVADRHPDATVHFDAPGTATARCIDGIDVAVTELLENAIQHNDDPHPVVDVAVTERADDVTVTVTDDATPIPDVEANVLTGHHDMTDVYHSSGLGLWLVYWLVELSNGSITVDSGETGNRIQVTFDQVSK